MKNLWPAIQDAPLAVLLGPIQGSLELFVLKVIPGDGSIAGLAPLLGGAFDYCYCLIDFALGYPLKGGEPHQKLAG